MKMKMKRPAALLLALLLVFTNLSALPVWAESGDVTIDATNFPDATFMEYVKTFDTDNNGILSQAELDAVTEIDVKEKGITDLKGIEYFTKLEKLDCQKNQLTALDVSHNTELTYLDCKENQLASLDVSKNTALTTLYCTSNQLPALDVSQNTSLRVFYCDENQLSALDVSQNAALREFYCDYNQLTSLDVSKNTALVYLGCGENQLPALDVSKNKELKILGCYNNQLTSLNVSNNAKLEYLYCNNNQLTSLDVSKNRALILLDCGENQLTTLDVSNNPELQVIYCSTNQLSALDVSNNTDLMELNCGGNHLTNLDLTVNTKIFSFGGKYEKYDININEDTLNFDLSSLPGSFDVSKAKNWVGGTVSGNILSPGTEKVAYDYDAGNGHTLNVTLNIKNATFKSIRFLPGEGTGEKESVSVVEGASYKLPSSTFTPPEGKVFKAWKIADNEYAVGDEIVVNEDLTATAVWKEAPTINFIKVNSDSHKTEYKVGDELDVSNLYIGVVMSDATVVAVNVTEDMVSGFDSSTVGTKTLTITYMGKTTTYDINVSPREYTVSFDKNGGTGEMEAVTVNAGVGLQLPDCDFGPPDGKVFDAWDVDGEKIAPNKFIRPTKDTTVKALWTEDTPTPPTPGENVTITFDKNGGTGTMADVTKNKGDSYELPAPAPLPPLRARNLRRGASAALKRLWATASL